MAATKTTTVENGSVLAEGTSITGRISGDGDLEVRGRIEGEITISGALVLAEGALARATLGGARVTIAGAVLGDVTGTEAIVLEATARVVGNLRAPRIAIALGAQIRGDLDMGEVDVGEPARPARAAATPPRAARGPITPAKPVVVQRKAPVAAPAPAPAPEARKAPPEPVVPAIKKGAKAVAKKKG